MGIPEDVVREALRLIPGFTRALEREAVEREIRLRQIRDGERSGTLGTLGRPAGVRGDMAERHSDAARILRDSFPGSRNVPEVAP